MTAIPAAEASGLAALDRLHTIVCDSCGHRFRDEGDGFYAWPSMDLAYQAAVTAGWETSHGWDYCPNCKRGAS